MEYSRNLLFSSGRQMDRIFQALIDRTRGPLDLDRARTIFGDKKRPHYDTRKKNPPRRGVVVEKPAHDVTVFKVHYGKMTLKAAAPRGWGGLDCYTSAKRHGSSYSPAPVLVSRCGTAKKTP